MIAGLPSLAAQARAAALCITDPVTPGQMIHVARRRNATIGRLHALLAESGEQSAAGLARQLPDLTIGTVQKALARMLADGDVVSRRVINPGHGERNLWRLAGGER